MKKNVVLLTLALVATTLSSYAQVSFGVKAGYNSSTISIEENEGTSRLSGFHAGVIADLSLAESFSLQPQLLYSAKGIKVKDLDMNGNETKVSFKMNYLELPVNFLYKPQVGAGKLFVGAGPYLALGLGGKFGDAKVKFDGKKSADIDETDDNVHAKALDAGANFLAGYELKNGLLFSINYSLGLTNWSPDGDKSKNSYLGISVGYLLHSGKKK
ncbi:Outer membrane protein beta-barrel domain-containing protein [Chitinophaga rupis]|uniref:Outer membrane protein beta-barrel domain-containing protein n=1 Tax=Chitinophaga rupis TaxID=573321 RepID=A0A1H7KQE5_9BACT|nr:porin family protein [Chitinophaga rupis]SEK88285.1 Outer membrane protein beta-barrel domain-containing protein [Chitinophaga rupis]